MRTGVLSDPKIIELLNEQFVNVFVLLGDLPEFQSGTKGEPVSRLANTISASLEEAVAQGAGRSVNTFILSSELELISHLPYRKPGEPHINKEIYGTFLKEVLDGKLPGLAEEAPHSVSAAPMGGLNIVFTPQKSEQETLSIFRTPEPGFQDYTVIAIDTTAFKEGGVLTIDISVGHAEAAGSFDLFDGESELPTQGAPQNALVSAWGVPPGKSRSITYAFDQGQHFKLGSTGDWFSEKGSINAFLAKISVEPNRKPEPRKVSSARLDQSAEDTMNAFVKAFKNLDGETLLPMLTGHARETFEGDFTDAPEDMRAQISEMLGEMEILSSEYVGDEFHFRLRIPMGPQQEVSVKMRQVEGMWFIYDVK